MFKKNFEVDYLPPIDLSLPKISLAANIMTGKLSISGIQPKLSMKLNKKEKN